MPTLRQKLAVKKISDFIRNNGFSNMNYGQILLDSGYSESVSKKPQLVIGTKGFKKLLKDELEENLVSIDIQVKYAHRALLFQNENLSVKARAIDMYYKMTGAYQPIKINHGSKQTIFSQMTPVELNYTIKYGELPDRYKSNE